MKFRLWVVTLVVGLLLAGCVKTPPTMSPVGAVAVRGVQVIEALRATIPTIKVLTCTPQVPSVTCIKTADAMKIAVLLEQAADKGKELSEALYMAERALQAGDKLTGVNQAKAILASMQQMLTTAAVTPDNEPARQQLVQLFSNVTALLFAVQPSS